MIKNLFSTMFALCGVLTLGSCSEDSAEVLDAGTEPAALLRLQTRGGNNETSLSDGRLYLFNNKGNCVGLYSMDNSHPNATIPLTAGTFDIYAVGGRDLSCFSLPTQQEASPSSELQCLSGAMDDLLLQHTQIALTNGESQQLNIALERKVIYIDQVIVNNVPEEVTDVEVSISPLYQKVRLDGSYPEDTDTLVISLTQGSGHTWETTTGSYHFPSSGHPIVTVRLTSPSGVESFAYTATEDLAANHHVTINATKTTSMPTVGSSYLGCYVVAVEGNTATLLSPTNTNGYNIDYSYQEKAWNTINKALKSWSMPEGVSGNWRVPTTSEQNIILADRTILPLEQGATNTYLCNDNGVLKSIDVVGASKNGKIYNKVKTPGTYVGKHAILWPVMDITL